MKITVDQPDQVHLLKGYLLTHLAEVHTLEIQAIQEILLLSAITNLQELPTILLEIQGLIVVDLLILLAVSQWEGHQVHFLRRAEVAVVTQAAVARGLQASHQVAVVGDQALEAPVVLDHQEDQEEVVNSYIILLDN